MKCDYCNNEAQLVGGDTIYPHRPDLYELKYYYCADDEAWVGCHRGTTKPLGRLANAELRQAKQDAHVAFDQLWRATTPAGSFDRNGAYGWLADQLGIPRADCHIGMMDVERCRLVVGICNTAVQDREAMGGVSENRLQEALDILWCDPVANERARLERKIITAAKQWAEHPETPKPSSEDVPLYDAIIALIDFESSQ